MCVHVCMYTSACVSVYVYAEIRVLYQNNINICGQYLDYSANFTVTEPGPLICSVALLVMETATLSMEENGGVAEQVILIVRLP